MKSSVLVDSKMKMGLQLESLAKIRLVVYQRQPSNLLIMLL